MLRTRKHGRARSAATPYGHPSKRWARLLVCYSGGVDSALVLAVAHEVLGARAVGMTAVSPSLAPFEKEAAVAIARQIGARHELVESRDSSAPGTWRTRPTAVFTARASSTRLPTASSASGVSPRAQWDQPRRPGRPSSGARGREERERAQRARRVRLSQRRRPRRSAGHGPRDWDKPASACLSSRIPYGTEVTRERLAQIGGLEADLRRLGLRQVRVRWHALGGAAGDRALARVEVARDELAAAFDVRDAIIEAASDSDSRTRRSTSRAIGWEATTRSSPAGPCGWSRADGTLA